MIAWFQRFNIWRLLNAIREKLDKEKFLKLSKTHFNQLFLGNKVTPSYVAFTDTERLIGDGAKDQVARNPQNTIFDAKRLIGRRFDDASVQSDMKHWPFKVANLNGKPACQVEFMGQTKTFRPEEISSMVLTKMKETAEAFLGLVN